MHPFNRDLIMLVNELDRLITGNEGSDLLPILD
jgi:hypothetical protein